MTQSIVVLDGYTINPGDVSWSAFGPLGHVQVHDRTVDADVVSRTGQAPYVLTNKTVLRESHFAALPTLRYVGVLATGTNVVDLAAAKARGIVVTNVPGYSTASVAQHVFALLLELTNQVGQHARAVRDGAWNRCEDFSFTLSPLVELEGKTLGIVGLGAIGKAVAKIGQALGMRVLATGRNLEAIAKVPGVTPQPLNTLLAESDVLTLHCPLTDATKHIINAQTLSQMKRGSILINTGRGPLLDEAAVAAALHSGQLGGAGLDVLSTEPPGESQNPLIHAPRCIITPHIAWASREARLRLMHLAAANLRAFIQGKPQNVVNP